MPIKRALGLSLAAAFLSLSSVSVATSDESYPTDSIEIIVPFPAGGTADILARMVAEGLSDAFNQGVAVVNRPGGAGAVGANAAARSAADGYTLFLGTTGTQTMNQWIQEDLAYEPLEDFVAVANFAESPFVLVVHPDYEAQTLEELIDLAQDNPGDINYASFGVGSSAHLTGELLKMEANIDLVHVPYDGAPPALSDVAGGHVESMFSMLPAALPLIRGGRVHAIAVAAEERNPALPDTPTFDESGVPGFLSGSWYGILAPAGTPDSIVTLLNEEINRILEDPEVQERLAEEGAQPVPGSPSDFGNRIEAEAAQWRDVVEAAGL